jgi:cardiolipin synthase
MKKHQKYCDCLNRALTYEMVSNTPQTDDFVAAYLKNTVGFSPAVTGDCAYFPSGEETIARLLNELSKAEKYIFLEYFIIDDGLIWESIHTILAQKAACGVDVRIICDGVGCLFTLLQGFTKQMAELGIKAAVFNTARLNTRNHRKIAVIDGRRAFCCGLNIADRYANITQMYGYFKDCGIMVDGGTAWNMSLLFLSMWEFVTKQRVQYSEFLPEINNCLLPAADCQLTIPLHDTPGDTVPVSEHTIINIISRAEKYVYITTPYFMCSNEIIAVMHTAARSGVDVRLITPFVADKKLVKLATESYYPSLIENHVRVFEYIGFIHAKSIIADGKRAMIGTINLDYRSLFSDYECGIYLFGGKIVDDINEDFKMTLSQSKEVTLDDLNSVSRFKRMIQLICRFFAPFF